MNTLGSQLLLDIWLKKNISENDIDSVLTYVHSRFTVVNKLHHKFTPIGETIVLVLSESHFAIHTYPEENYLSVDLYICGDKTDLFEVSQEILSLFHHKEYKVSYHRRGVIPPLSNELQL